MNRERDSQPRIRRENQGFSLLEVLLAMGLVSIIFYGLASMMATSVKASRTAEMSSSHLELANIVRLILGKAASCTVNLRDQVLDTAALGAKPLSLFFLKQDPSDPIGVKGDPLLPTSRYGNLNVEPFQLYPYTQLGPNSWIVRTIVATRKTGTYFGGERWTSEISAQVEIDVTGKILRCVGLSNADLALSTEDNVVNEKICELAYDGTMVYDPAKKICVTNDNCYGDTAAVSSCPAGEPITGCDAKGIVDLKPVEVSRGYPGGRTVSGGPPLHQCTIDRNTNKASCEYAVDTDITNAKCLACCRSLKLLTGP